MKERLTMKEYAAMLGVTRSTLYRWIAKNPNLPKPYRVGGRRYINRRDVVAFLDNAAQGAAR